MCINLRINNTTCVVENKLKSMYGSFLKGFMWLYNPEMKITNPVPF